MKENRSDPSSQEKNQPEIRFSPLSRRTFLKRGIVGVICLTGSVGVVNILEALTLPEGWAVALTKGVVLWERDLCSGCRTCEAICTNYNDKGRSSSAQARIILEKDYLEGKYEANTCYQCVKPLCLHICPEEAIKVDKDSGTNARIIDDVLCIGCGRCIEACGSVFIPPRPRFNPEFEQVVKCNLCFGDPQCVKYCPYGALRFEWSEKGVLTGHPVLKEGYQTMYGWVGKILRVNLTNGKIEVVSTPDYVPTYLGGRGLGARIYWEEVSPDVGAFDPENRLIFITGPLQGTLAPTSGRFMVIGKAAQTAPVESYCRSGVGGHWAPELKWAGFDAVVVYGQASKPVYLFIHDGNAELRDAAYLWGMDPFSTQEAVWGVHGKETRVMTIGKAGEMKSRLGIIITDSGDASGQGGYGGVMGSKNLKAIAVRGTGSVKVAKPKELMDVTRHIHSLFSRPSKPGSPLEPIEPGFKYNIWGGQDRGQLTGAPGELWDLCASPTSGYERAPDGCYACPIGCRTRVRGPDIPSGVAQCVQSMMYMESIGLDPERGYSKLAWEAGRLADYYGINAYEIHGIIPWLAACYKNDVLDEDGIDIPLDEIGSRRFIQKLLKKIAYREGFGDQLAEGCQRTATSLGGKAEELMHPLYPRGGKFGGYREHWLNYGGFPGGYAISHLALLWALDNRDAMVSHNLMSQLWGAATTLGYPSQMADANKLIRLLRPVMKYSYGSEEAAEFFASDGIGLRWDWTPRLAKRFFERSILKDSYIVCDVAFPFLYNPNSKDHIGDSSLESRLFTAITGVEMNEEESYQAGNMLCTLERAIQAREGRTSDDDVLRDICFTNKDIAGRQYQHMDLERAKAEFYKLCGWDQRGIPTAKKLKALKLSDVAHDLKKGGTLSPDGKA